MRVEVKEENAKKELPFPKLMVAGSGRIVLMVSPKVGTAIRQGNGMGFIGEYSEDWCMHNFTDFHGTVTLSNE